jgi:hypothetical protein
MPIGVYMAAEIACTRWMMESEINIKRFFVFYV